MNRDVPFGLRVHASEELRHHGIECAPCPKTHVDRERKSLLSAEPCYRRDGRPPSRNPCVQDARQRGKQPRFVDAGSLEPGGSDPSSALSKNARVQRTGTGGDCWRVSCSRSTRSCFSGTSTASENRISQVWMQGTAEPTDDEREAVAEIGKRSGRGAPADTATLIGRARGRG